MNTIKESKIKELFGQDTDENLSNLFKKVAYELGREANALITAGQGEVAKMILFWIDDDAEMIKKQGEKVVEERTTHILNILAHRFPLVEATDTEEAYHIIPDNMNGTRFLESMRKPLLYYISYSICEDLCRPISKDVAENYQLQAEKQLKEIIRITNIREAPSYTAPSKQTPQPINIE